ncbi:hypothetical protein PAHAL_5G352600 [Panicum hallii]|jgi:hypothetical protein|uniref:Uncharacterized protein n=1 Tax=Panicum hallii TaxID=206008 RepID=A0A2T8IMD5_9POAL|nr:hypothetical protein PAHAL_5G352600 [Panicum hallii]
MCNIFILDANAFGFVQDPAVEPAWVTEGILPITMKRDDFYMTGETWAKFHSAHPVITFDEFLTIMLRSYEKCSTTAKVFLTEFKRDPARRPWILVDHALRREIRKSRIAPLPYTLPEGLKEPKPEPVETEAEPLEFMYHVPQ